MQCHKLKVLLYVTFVLCDFLVSSQFLLNAANCSISAQKDFPKDKEPFLLKRTKRGRDDADFFLPDYENQDDVFRVNKGERIYLVCPPASNYVSATKRHIQGVDCKGHNVLSVGNQNFNFSQLACHAEVKPDVQITGTKCARNGGTIIEIGFQAMGWHKTLRICHNIQLGHTYYTTHTVRTKLIKGGLYKRSNFQKASQRLYHGYDPNNYYKRTNQKEVFQRIVGKNIFEYVNKRQFLARGHLSPVKDFPLTTWQKFTFVYSNAAPQWMSINGGAWLSLETLVRENKKSDLYEVATGTHGVYKIKNKQGLAVGVSLNGDKIPVPEYFWKIVQDPVDKSCIAFVSINDPFLSAPPAPICTDVCARNKWPVRNQDMSKGFVYCCSYDDFKRAVVDVPHFDCHSTLHYV
ncbi:uncharacterized protein LOC106662359 [Cimex lectularius]|uniref:DNA/RNA non-specific endonuclease/pyrophosphatase/phosphodiesterase domain-containing protein n=1 Tax=Cimex lectularius TaxID=79782 RepID=A0A8I6RDM9_CIMLE|nr:uncharacterized protein LOC106662359 [Cimex lectularius]XP_014241899.1 uncharacterized protein LOC106662359 [Cimex lectularius]